MVSDPRFSSSSSSSKREFIFSGPLYPIRTEKVTKKRSSLLMAVQRAESSCLPAMVEHGKLPVTVYTINQAKGIKAVEVTKEAKRREMCECSDVQKREGLLTAKRRKLAS